MKIRIITPDHKITRDIITWAMTIVERKPGTRPFDFTVKYSAAPREVIGMDVPSAEWATLIALQFPVTVEVDT